MVIGLSLLATGLYLAGYDPGIALAALFSGAFGSWHAFTSATLVRAVPLILIGLGLALAFRGGAFNIGGEGQFYAGAIAATWIGLSVGGLPRLHAGLLLALAGALLLHWIFARTLWGFRLRAVGLGPRAAEIAGRIDSRWMAALALALSGAVAGLAGGVEVAGVSYALFQNLSPGYGFTAIAVALLGRLHPFGVILAGLLFGALEAGAGAMQREADVPAVAVYVVEAAVILTVLLAESAR